MPGQGRPSPASMVKAGRSGGRMGGNMGRWDSRKPSFPFFINRIRRNENATADVKKSRRIRLWAVLVWLLVWELASLSIGQEILLVSPVSVLLRLLKLMTGAEASLPEASPGLRFSPEAAAGFWRSVLFSFVRIPGGFLLAAVTGSLLAALSSVSSFVRDLLAPAMAAVKAVPVASIIILILIWIPSRNLSIIISYLMVLPVMYTNVLNGISALDPQLLEMARVFRIPSSRYIRRICLPQLLPFLRSGFSLSLGLCWKAGVAAEVIGIPEGSIGERLYEAKIYLETADLFAWTLVILILSVCFEKCCLFLLDRFSTLLEQG